MEWIKTILNAVRVAVQGVENTCTQKIEALKAKAEKLESSSAKTTRDLASLSRTVKSNKADVEDEITNLTNKTNTTSNEVNKKITSPSYAGGKDGYVGCILAYTSLGPRWYPQRAIIPVSSWVEVQKIVRSGIAEKMYRLGDQFICYHDSLGPIVWDIIGFDIDKPTDTTYTHSMTLQSHLLLKYMSFDTGERENPYTNIKNYGSSNWDTSDIRQWLNSAKGIGEWWEAKTEYDFAPPEVGTIPGFMQGLQEDFVNVLGVVSKTSRRNTVSSGTTKSDVVTTQDTFFLLSLSEAHAGTTDGESEGDTYPFYNEFSDHRNVISPQSYLAREDAIRNKRRDQDTYSIAWLLRSSYKNSPYLVCRVSSKGAIETTYADSTSGIAPACCIV